MLSLRKKVAFSLSLLPAHGPIPLTLPSVFLTSAARHWRISKCAIYIKSRELSPPTFLPYHRRRHSVGAKSFVSVVTKFRATTEMCFAYYRKSNRKTIFNFFNSGRAGAQDTFTGRKKFTRNSPDIPESRIARRRKGAKGAKGKYRVPRRRRAISTTSSISRTSRSRRELFDLAHYDKGD